jgi:hypothetical protein
VGPDSFEQVRSLDDAALRQLLERGRPEQRVWAIWVLAQHAGEAAGQLARGQAHQPDPGVRRTLAVVLASHGEIDLLIALARHDPSPAVRASAIQVATRLAGSRSPSYPGLRPLLESAREPAMVTAILGAIGAGAPDFLIDLAVRALSSGSFDVQLEALEALLRIDMPQTFSDAQQWLLALADPLPAAACEAWIRGAGGLGDPAARANGIDSLSRALAGAPVQTRARVLQQLQAPPWSAVARLIEGADSLLRQVLRRADIAIPARVLAGAILRGLHAGFVERLTAQLERAAQGSALLAEVRRGLDLDDVLPVLPGLTARALQLVRAREIAGAEEVLAELLQLHPVEQLVGLENALVRWLDDRAIGELAGVLPELRAYCERWLAALPPVVGRRRRPRHRVLRAYADAGGHPGGGAGIGDDPSWEARWHFEALLMAIRAMCP